MKRRVLSDERHQATLDEKGYVKVPFFNSEEVEEILSFYHSNISGLSKGYHSSMFSGSTEYRTTVHQFLKNKIKAKVQQIFDRHKIEICTFLVKESDDTSKVGLHCDWSLTDESQYQSIILWIPLCDVHEKNGAMYMLDGSQYFTNTIRGEGIPVPYDAMPDKFVKKKMKLVTAKKGEAVIFDLSTLHCSFPNFTDKPRIAFNVGLIPEEAPSYHYFVDENTPQGMYDIYEVDSDFYCRNVIGERPQGVKFLESKNLVFDGLSPEELMNKYKKSFFSI